MHAKIAQFGRGPRLTAAGVGVLLIVAFLAGPRPVVDATVGPAPKIPEDVDSWLAQRESQVGDVDPWATKMVVWHRPEAPAPTDLVVVYLHGYSATRQETAPLADTVAARLGANLFYARLSGHGRPGDRLAEVTAHDWLEDGAEAMAVASRLGERVLIIATSTGATVATWMAASGHWDHQLAGVAFISPNFRIRDPGARLLTLPWGGFLAELVLGDYRSWEAANPDQDRYWTTRYPTRAVLPMAALVKSVNGLDHGSIQTPLWMALSPNDQVVSWERAKEVFDAWGSDHKELVEVPESGDPANHVLAGDVLSPNTTLPLARSIVAFVQRSR